jgi:predicted acylesterase/phospholipase RssA
MTKPVLHVFVSPCSGGKFPIQLAMIAEYTEILRYIRGYEVSSIDDFIPHICLGSSGGNIANYIALASGWTKNGIFNIIQYLDSEMFSRNWWPKYMTFLPTWLLGLFKGSIYCPGYGPYPLFEDVFRGRKIESVEIWSGTYNTTRSSCELFCNKSSGSTLISSQTFLPNINRCMPLHFLDNDLKTVSDVAIASASIPIIFEKKQIGDDHYEDGGVIFSSPLLPLQEEIYKITMGIAIPTTIDVHLSTYPFYVDPGRIPLSERRSEQRTLHLIYFSSDNVDTQKASGITGTIIQLIDTISVLDRNSGIDIIVRLAGGNKADVGLVSGNLSELQSAMAEHKTDHYFLYLYCNEEIEVDMTSFTGKDAVKIMEKSKDGIFFNLFFV